MEEVTLEPSVSVLESLSLSHARSSLGLGGRSLGSDIARLEQNKILRYSRYSKSDTRDTLLLEGNLFGVRTTVFRISNQTFFFFFFFKTEV